MNNEQDVFYRAGCPVNITPVAAPDTMLLGGALRSTAAERADGHGAARATRACGAHVTALSSRAAVAVEQVLAGGDAHNARAAERVRERVPTR